MFLQQTVNVGGELFQRGVGKVGPVHSQKMIVGYIDQDTPAMAQGRVEASFAALEMGVGFGEAVDLAVQLQAPANLP